MAAVLACRLVAPADIKESCGEVVAILGAIAGVGNGGGKCLKITVGLVKPPVQVSLVPCPARPEPAPAPGFSPHLGVPAPSNPRPGQVVPVPGGPGILVPSVAV